MIHVSTEFTELMKERTDYRCFGELTLTDGSELTLGAGDFTMSGNSVTDGAGAAGLPLGAAVCRTARLSLADPAGKLAGRDLFGARLRLYLTFPLSETEERIELGTFTVTEPESRGETVTVTAADDMYRTDKAYTTALTYPATLGAMFREICDSCGVPYSTAAFVNSELSVASAPEEGYTCRQMLGYIAMLAGGNARVHRDGRMEILSYDPDKAPEHELGEWITLTPDTDDVTVTGLETADADGNKVLEGTEGYVLTVDNPLMAGKEAAALEAMGRRLIGLKVRRFEGEYVGYPLAECMDTARITDRKGRAFETVLTDVTFTFGGRTALSNSAAPAARNGGSYATPEAAARQAVRQLVAAERTAREAAVEALNDRLAKASGMYGTRQVQPDGSSIWYLHDKPTLAQSQAVMKLTSEAIGFSTDGGKSYPFGFSVTGEMVMGIIRSEGISADWVKVGGEGLGAVLEGFVGRDENNQIVSMLNASADQINIRGNRFVLDSDNFKVAADGTITAKNGQFAGRVSSSGTWPDGMHTLNIEDSRINISIGSKRNLSIGQAAGSGGSIAGSYISVYSGDNDNGVLLDDDARRTDVYGSQVHVGVDKNGVAKGWVSCGSLTSSGAITADGNVSAEGAISAGGNVTADGSVSAGGSISAGGNVTATCGKRKLSLKSGPGDTYEGLYSPDLGQWLLTIDENKVVRLVGNADSSTKLATARTINGVPFDGTKDITVKVAHPLTFTGGATGSYDGSDAKTVKIPSAAADVGALPISGGTLTGNLTVGTGNNTLNVGSKVNIRTDGEGGNIRITSPSGAIYAEMDCWNNSAFRIYIHSNAGDFQGFNIGTNSSSTFIRGSADRVANALTFTGGAKGSYDGSAAKSVKIPHIVTGVVTITPPNTNQNYQTVKFASGTFSSAPRMFLQLAGSAISKIFLGITSVTKDSFQIAYARTDSASAFNVHWMAVEGMG